MKTIDKICRLCGREIGNEPSDMVDSFLCEEVWYHVRCQEKVFKSMKGEG